MMGNNTVNIYSQAVTGIASQDIHHTHTSQPDDLNRISIAQALQIHATYNLKKHKRGLYRHSHKNVKFSVGVCLQGTF